MSNEAFDKSWPSDHFGLCFWGGEVQGGGVWPAGTWVTKSRVHPQSSDQQKGRLTALMETDGPLQGSRLNRCPSFLQVSHEMSTHDAESYVKNKTHEDWLKAPNFFWARQRWFFSLEQNSQPIYQPLATATWFRVIRGPTELTQHKWTVKCTAEEQDKWQGSWGLLNKKQLRFSLKISVVTLSHLFRQYLEKISFLDAHRS